MDYLHVQADNPCYNYYLTLSAYTGYLGYQQMTKLFFPVNSLELDK